MTNPQTKPDKDDNINKLYLVSAVCLVFMIIEIIGGYIANSIAIMSDAAHLFSDFLGFIISIASIKIAKRQATNYMSYGFHRAEIIGALASVTIIWGLTIWLIYEAIWRIFNPHDVDGLTMFIVACLGLLFNFVMGLILMYEGIEHGHGLIEHDHDHDHSHDFLSNHHHKQRKSCVSLGKIELKKEENEGNEGNEKKEIGKINDDCCCQDSNKEDVELGCVNDNKQLLLKEGIHKDDHHDHDHHDHDHSHHDHDHHSHHDHDHHHHKSHEDVNIKAAMIHILGDAIQNIGVIISGIIIYFRPDLRIVDSICTFVFAIIVFFTTIRILKECVSVIMEGSPIESIENMEEDLLKVDGVMEVHDLHVWSLSMGKMIMTAHLVSDKPQESLKLACEMIFKKYGIDHSTIQVEGKVEDVFCKQTLH